MVTHNLPVNAAAQSPSDAGHFNDAVAGAISKQEQIILGQEVYTEEKLTAYLDAHPRLKKRFERDGKSNWVFQGSPLGAYEPVAAWGGVLFVAPKSDVRDGHSAPGEAAAASCKMLADMARTTSGAYILNAMDDKYEGHWHKIVVLHAGYPGSPDLGDRIVAVEDEAHVINGQVSKARILDHDPTRHAGPHGRNNGKIDITYQYALYEIKDGQDWNDDPEKPRIASSPSDVLAHEFTHDFNSFNFVSQYLNLAMNEGIKVDVNNNDVPDWDEKRKAFKSARHSHYKIMPGMNSAIFMEKAFIMEKNARGYIDYLPRPDDNLSGEPQYGVAVRVDDPTQIRPISTPAADKPQ